ncbi:TfoX/Sxy family DNA transformation protein [Eggerthella sp. YY7918]|uniref:TfoX/Sxy family DNA transformation protein n=1 Tax=Eggerthella sp. (strain YY7918) TaxID=502558 RepID=UPI0002171746|nr:TfoX/Sxy family DNA transformation protein [Eggerthella sp. YY7918]BAK45587.1 hypothetical protein EGYY_25790 [Eggerthella sp. YY7918]
MIDVTADKHPGKPIRAFFIDSENGAEKLLEGMEFLTRSDTVIVFHRDNFPAELKNRLELGPSAVEWIKCVDRGVKNSMDVQIIAELSMRLVEGGFENGYIVSEDKGYLPAVHYLQRTPKGREHEVALVKDIAHAVMRTIFSSMTKLKHAESVENVEETFAPLYGEGEARVLTGKLEKIFAQLHADSQKDVGAVQCDEGAMSKSLTEGVDQLVDEPTEQKSKSVSFIDMPGIGRALAGKLESAGIASPAELEQIGAVEAWKRIYYLDASFPPKWVYSFEAAIRGVSIRSLDPKRKRRLKSDIRALLIKQKCAA